ncbi:MAG: hypothetical protein J0L93_09650 [Deltaproteobacteria bacterium]|nr:hypothetical protein [Deltaproteobacteria bacterium]
MNDFLENDANSDNFSNPDSPFDQFSQNPWLKILFLPGCFLLAAITESSGLIRWLSFGFGHWFHEIGHSLFAWLSGRASIPLLGFAPMSLDKSIFTYLCALFLIGVIGVQGYRYKSPYLIFIAAALFIAQCFYTFIASHQAWEMSMVYGGVGGEFILSSIFIAAFSVHIPTPTYWPLLRFIVVPWSVISFWQSFMLWLHIYRSEALIPWGTIWGGEEDTNGDMNRLHLEFGFSRENLASTYVTTATICLVFIGIVYLISAVPAVQKILKSK